MAMVVPMRSLTLYRFGRAKFSFNFGARPSISRSHYTRRRVRRSRDGGSRRPVVGDPAAPVTFTASLPAAVPSPTCHAPLRLELLPSRPAGPGLFLVTENPADASLLAFDSPQPLPSPPRDSEQPGWEQQKQLRDARRAAVVQYGAALRRHLSTVSASLAHCIDLTQTHANSATLVELRRLLRDAPAGGNAVAAAAGLAERLTQEQQHLEDDLEALRESVTQLRRLLQLGA
jgi:hypothetical protein